jgi:hypothetical protein
LKNKSQNQMPRTVKLLLVVLSIFLFTFPVAAETWSIVVAPDWQKDEAIKVALGDLKDVGKEQNLTFNVVSDSRLPKENCIVLGNSQNNKQTTNLASQLNLKTELKADGYQIVSFTKKNKRVIVVSGADVMGDVYGLFWLCDRIRVFNTVPEINTIRESDSKVRLSPSWGRRGSGGETKELIRNALRGGINWVSGPPVLDLIPWKTEPERSNNEKNRQRAKELIKYAHSLHIKYYSFAAEATYHPAMIKEFGATLSPCDPSFWDALQAKYRRLFQALPELDGIEICNDDISGFWENYRAYDVLHDETNCDWTYEKKFNTFVKKVYNVVVNEFDKTYFHFTWSLVSNEQHHMPSVFKKIFSDDLPVKNLYLIPKITQSDRWWYQAYNTTFNVTPHNTLVGFETMNYYESSKANIFPTCAGAYYQAGLQLFFGKENSNVRGTAFGFGRLRSGYGTGAVYSYILGRLSWDHQEDIKTIVRDFCAIHFGLEAAEEMAEIYLMTENAYKYGLHIEPISHGQYNSFLHMRVGTFPAMGYPRLDGGTEHLEFLRSIYLRSKPWQVETIMLLDHGLSQAKEMRAKFENVQSKIKDPALVKELAHKLEMTERLINTNGCYAKNIFAYFAYSEKQSAENKNKLSAAYDELLAAKKAFMETPGYYYQLFGVNQILANSKALLQDYDLAKNNLKKQPKRADIEDAIRNQQSISKSLMKKYGDQAVKFFEFEGGVDGRDILHIKDDNFEIEHLRWDHPFITATNFFKKLPRQNVTVFAKDIESRPMHQFVLEQPCKENDYTAQIYLYDEEGGTGPNHFELYYIPLSPEETGMPANL